MLIPLKGGSSFSSIGTSQVTSKLGASNCTIGSLSWTGRESIDSFDDISFTPSNTSWYSMFYFWSRSSYSIFSLVVTILKSKALMSISDGSSIRVFPNSYALYFPFSIACTFLYTSYSISNSLYSSSITPHFAKISAFFGYLLSRWGLSQMKWLYFAFICSLQTTFWFRLWNSIKDFFTHVDDFWITTFSYIFHTVIFCFLYS